jgi:hypothetical protein
MNQIPLPRKTLCPVSARDLDSNFVLLGQPFPTGQNHASDNEENIQHNMPFFTLPSQI